MSPESAAQPLYLTCYRDRRLIGCNPEVVQIGEWSNVEAQNVMKASRADHRGGGGRSVATVVATAIAAIAERPWCRYQCGLAEA